LVSRANAGADRRQAHTNALKTALDFNRTMLFSPFFNKSGMMMNYSILYLAFLLKGRFYRFAGDAPSQSAQG
jgi:hypothetical protein